jgi:hypothetical protein
MKSVSHSTPCFNPWPFIRVHAPCVFTGPADQFFPATVWCVPDSAYSSSPTLLSCSFARIPTSLSLIMRLASTPAISFVIRCTSQPAHRTSPEAMCNFSMIWWFYSGHSMLILCSSSPDCPKGKMERGYPNWRE